MVELGGYAKEDGGSRKNRMNRYQYFSSMV
jgi:hypothetical protein